MMGHVTAVPGHSRADTHLAERLERPKVGARQLSGGKASYNQQWETQAPKIRITVAQVLAGSVLACLRPGLPRCHTSCPLTE